MISVFDMRVELYRKYPGPRWKARVMKMSDSQIIAVWRSIEERKKKSENTNEPMQLKLFDI